jgi:hypothetical protein
MIYIKIHTQSGNTIATGFNGTLQEAKEYYHGQSHISEDYLTGKETIDPYTNVELIN